MTEERLKALLIEAGEFIDSLDNLPVEDDGTRTIPPGFLDAARPIADMAFDLRAKEQAPC